MNPVVSALVALMIALGDLLSSFPPVASSHSDAVVDDRPPRAVDASGTGTTTLGVASWYRWRLGQAAAGPALRTGRWRGRFVRVCAETRCVVVRLTDWCACPGGRLIDLDARSFARIAPLSRGLVRVTVSVERPLPATDRW
jgi:hypothetical protein